MGSIGLAGLYASFASYHLTKVLRGDGRSCSCFGTLLSLEPLQMVLLCVIAAGVAVTVTPGAVDLLRHWYRQGSPAERLAFHLVLACFVAVGVYRTVEAGQKETGSPLQFVPTFAGDLAELKGIGTVRRTTKQSSKGALVVFVDLNCPYSRAFLERFNELEVPPDFEVELTLYPIFPSEQGFSQDAVSLMSYFPQAEFALHPRATEPTHRNHQVLLADRYARRSVPVALVRYEDHLFQVDTGRFQARAWKETTMIQPKPLMLMSVLIGLATVAMSGSPDCGRPVDAQTVSGGTCVNGPWWNPGPSCTQTTVINGYCNNSPSVNNFCKAGTRTKDFALFVLRVPNAGCDGGCMKSTQLNRVSFEEPLTNGSKCKPEVEEPGVSTP